MTSNLRRFTEHKDHGAPYALERSHMAVRLGTSLFREGRLRAPKYAGESLLKNGKNNRKIGKTIVKGRWKGFPVFTLTLEERATCPRTCGHWLDCYGNKMNWPTRFMADHDLIPTLDRELSDLAVNIPNFVIRLHVLGDFFSVAYVEQWARWLDEFPGLNIYGYTAWQPGTQIGDAVSELATTHWERFSVRTSNGDGDRTTRTIYSANASGIVDGGIVCPVQTGKTECCATCALCWGTQRQIVFLAH
jgi:hypothetical protein